MLLKYLKKHNIEEAVDALRNLKFNRKAMCSLLIMKTLEKSGNRLIILHILYMCVLFVVLLVMAEDDRTHVSYLFKKMKDDNLITSEEFYEVCAEYFHVVLVDECLLFQVLSGVLSSANDVEVSLPQCKTYIAGFIARGIAQVYTDMYIMYVMNVYVHVLIS